MSLNAFGDINGGSWNFLGLLSSASFFGGITFLLWGRDHSQTSLRTVSLLAISSLLGLPLGGGSTAQWVFYFVFVAIWASVIFRIFYQGRNNNNQEEGGETEETPRSQSALKKTYDRDLDSFPHWICCLVPSIAAFFCIYFFLDDTIFGYCSDHFSDDSTNCTSIFLQLASVCILVLAFVPQGYCILKVWAGHSEKSSDGRLHFRVKVFMACMFACFCLRSVSWVWWVQHVESDAEKIAGESVDFSALYETAYFLAFFCGNTVTAIVIAFPWIYYATCVKCCGCCILVKPNKSSAVGGGDLTMNPNTGQSNTDPAALEMQGGNNDDGTTSKWSSWSPFAKTNKDSTAKDHETAPDIEQPGIMGINTTWHPETQASTTNAGTSPTYNNHNSNNNAYYTSSTVPTSKEETPDWLRD